MQQPQHVWGRGMRDGAHIERSWLEFLSEAEGQTLTAAQSLVAMIRLHTQTPQTHSIRQTACVLQGLHLVSCKVPCLPLAVVRVVVGVSLSLLACSAPCAAWTCLCLLGSFHTRSVPSCLLYLFPTQAS